MAAIRATARVSNLLFRKLPFVNWTIYGAYKWLTERGGIALVCRLVKPGDRAVDVGANIGFHAEQLARCAGPQGKVYAFDPGAYFDVLCMRRSGAANAGAEC
jgi:hypothetical protein